MYYNNNAIFVVSGGKATMMPIIRVGEKVLKAGDYTPNGFMIVNGDNLNKMEASPHESQKLGHGYCPTCAKEVDNLLLFLDRDESGYITAIKACEGCADKRLASSPVVVEKEVGV